MSIDVEYAIKKDIRNNPVLREVDARQRREFLTTALVVGCVVATGLFSAWRHYEIVQNGYEMQKLQQARTAAEIENRRLRLEVEQLRAPQRIETIARHDLHMVPASAKDTLVIERVTTSTPDKAIVAALR